MLIKGLGVVSGVLLMLGSAVPVSAASQPDCSTVVGNLVADCGFEQPALGNTPSQFFSGSTTPPKLAGVWQTQSSGVDGSFDAGGVTLLNNLANGGIAPNSGQQSLQLIGGGGVQQTLPTTQGHDYMISFALGNSPTNCIANENEISVTWGSSPGVGVAGTQTNFAATVAIMVTPGAPGWHQVSFPPLKGAANSKQSFLSFLGVPQAFGNTCGSPVLDDVVVIECQAKKNGC